MKLHFLQSGSSGNCTLLVLGNTKILIDVGLTVRTINQRLNSFNYNLDDIDAILVTHEHIDHIKSIRYCNNKKVYATKETLDLYDFNKIVPYEEFYVNDIKILPISMSHDVTNGVGYIIFYKDIKIVYLTDTGYVTKKNINLMKDANYIVLESNYDLNSLIYSSRPIVLKNRIKGRKGHLSNGQCAEVLEQIISNKTKYIFLAHISGDCNSKQLALSSIINYFDYKNIDISKINIIPLDRNDITIGVDNDE